MIQYPKKKTRVNTFSYNNHYFYDTKLKHMTHALNLVWNPSEGIDLGFFMIRFYSLMFVVAFGLGWYIMKHIFEEKENLLNRFFIYLDCYGSLIGARLGHVFFMIGNITKSFN
jgi:prolipoprotein diacylglyceryltransferase